jgi:bifunctional DNA-binding transcriptional regulator/antitoxin component of YhaV-PrlF toxin-antitoxin module
MWIYQFCRAPNQAPNFLHTIPIPTRQKLGLIRKREGEEEEEEDDDDEYLVLVSSSPRLQSQLPRAATKRGQKE